MDVELLKGVKKLELDILKFIDQVCRENNLKYYLVGGTLLGAVRHKGFIPWDDDIDIAMFRSDYDKLITILKKGDSKHFLQNCYTDKKYTKYITKIRLKGTMFVERTVEGIDISHGIFIDIFPLDKINHLDEKSIDRIVRIADYIKHLLRVKNNKKKAETILGKVRNFTLVFIPSRYLAFVIDILYTKNNKSDTNYITNFSSQYGWRKQTFPIDVYGEGTYLEFEGHQFMAPAKWEVILKSLYGDYMKLPPEEKRNSGHDIVHIDLGKYAEN